jgi:hypothetical protein
MTAFHKQLLRIELRLSTRHACASLDPMFRDAPAGGVT